MPSSDTIHVNFGAGKTRPTWRTDASQGWLNRRTLTWAGYDVASSVYFGIAPAVLLPLYFQKLMAGFANPTAAWGALAAGAILASSVAALIAAALSARMSRLTLLTVATAGLVLCHRGTGLAALPVAGAWPRRPMWRRRASISRPPASMNPSCPTCCRRNGGRSSRASAGPSAMSAAPSPSSSCCWLVRGQAESTGLIEDCFAVLAIISAAFFLIVLTLMRRAGFAASARALEGPHLRASLPSLASGAAPRTLRAAGGHHAGAPRRLGGGHLHGPHPRHALRTDAAGPAVAAAARPCAVGALHHRLEHADDQLVARWCRWPSCSSAWGFVLLLMAFGSGRWMPVVTVAVIGCCVGATASALRGFLAEGVPPGSAPAFFALATVAGRVAAALGPALFALITTLRGEQTALMVVLLLLARGRRAGAAACRARRGAGAAGPPQGRRLGNFPPSRWSFPGQGE